MSKTVQLRLGAIAPKLDKQLEGFGLDDNTIARLQRIADSITGLYIAGYLPSSQVDRCRTKLVKEIQSELRDE